jgi:hypothetical protein
MASVSLETSAKLPYSKKEATPLLTVEVCKGSLYLYHLPENNDSS